MEVRTISLDDIDIPAEQVRTWTSEEELSELAGSIKEIGLINPITVRTNGDRYKLIAGWRRLQAHRQLGLVQIAASVVDADQLKEAWIMLTENASREDVDAWSEARFLLKLTKEHGLTQEDIGKTLGKSRSWVAGRLRLVRLDHDMQDLVKDKLLAAEKAIELGRISDLPTQRYYAKLAVENGASLRTIRAWVRNFMSESRAGPPPEGPIPEPQEYERQPMAIDSCVICTVEDGEDTVIWQPVCNTCLRSIRGQGATE